MFIIIIIIIFSLFLFNIECTPMMILWSQINEHCTTHKFPVMYVFTDLAEYIYVCNWMIKNITIEVALAQNPVHVLYLQMAHTENIKITACRVYDIQERIVL